MEFLYVKSSAVNNRIMDRSEFFTQKSHYVRDNFAQIFQNIVDETKKPLTKINYHNFFKKIDKSSYDLINPKIAKVDLTLLSQTIDYLVFRVVPEGLSRYEIGSLYKLYFALPVLTTEKLANKVSLPSAKRRKITESKVSQNLLTHHFGGIGIRGSNSKRIDELLSTSISRMETIISKQLDSCKKDDQALWFVIGKLLIPQVGSDKQIGEPGTPEELIESTFMLKCVSPFLVFLDNINMFERPNSEIVCTREGIQVRVPFKNPLSKQTIIAGHVTPDISIKLGNKGSDHIRAVIEVKKPHLFDIMTSPEKFETPKSVPSDILKQLFGYLYASRLNVGVLTDCFYLGVFMIEEPLTDIVKPKIGPPPKPSIPTRFSYKYFDLAKVYEENQASDYVSGQLLLATLALQLWPENLQAVGSSSKKKDSDVLTFQQKQLLEKFIRMDDIELRKRPAQSHSNDSNVSHVNVGFNSAYNQEIDRIEFELISKGGYETPQEVILLTKDEFLNSEIYEAGEFEVSRESLPREIILKIYDEKVINKYITNERNVEDFSDYQEERFNEIYEIGYNNELASYRRINTYNRRNSDGPHINTAQLLGHGYLSDMNRYKSAKFIALSKLEFANDKPKTKEEFNLGIEQIKLINSLHIMHCNISLDNVCFDRTEKKFFIFDFSDAEIVGGHGLDETDDLMALYDLNSQENMTSLTAH